MTTGPAPRKRVLITGAGGFVGSHLARLSAAQGFDTFACIRRGAGLGRLAGDIGSLAIVEADLEDPASLARLAGETRPDVAFHLAWHIAPDVHVAPENRSCADGSLALLGALDEVSCPRNVFTGTYLEYAPSDEPLTESSPIAPRNPYAAHKNALREAAAAEARSRGTELVWARLFNVYGPSEYAWPLIPFVINRLLDGAECELTRGDQVRAFLHVEDAARALLTLGMSRIEGPVNVGSDEPTTVRDVALKIGELTGRSDLLRFGSRPLSPHDDARVVADLRRLTVELGFVARHSLGSGLADTVASWQSRRRGSARPTHAV